MLELRGCWDCLKILLSASATLWGAGSLLLLGLDLHLGLDFQEYKCLGSVFIYKNEVISPSKVVLTREHDFLGAGNFKLRNLGQLSLGMVSHATFPLLTQTKMQTLALSEFSKITKVNLDIDSNSNAIVNFNTNANFSANANFNANSSFNFNSNLTLKTSFYPCFKSGVYSLELNDKWGPFKAHDMLVKEVVASGVCVERITPKFLGWIKVSNSSGALKYIEGDIGGNVERDVDVEGDAAASSIAVDATNSTQNDSEKTVANTALSSGAVPNIGSEFGTELNLGLNRGFNGSFEWGYEVTLLKTPSIYVANDLLIISRARESWFCLGASTRNASILKDALERDAILNNVNEKAKSKPKQQSKLTSNSSSVLNSRFKAKELTFIKCQKSTSNQVSNTHNYASIKVWRWRLVQALEQALAQGTEQIFDPNSVLTQALASTLSLPPVLSSDFRWREIYVVPKSILMDANLTYRINLNPDELFIMGGTKEALDSRILGGLPNTKTKLRAVKWYLGQRPRFTSTNKHLFWDRRFYSDLY